MTHPHQVILSLHELEVGLADQLEVLNRGGVCLDHLVGFAVYALNERTELLVKANHHIAAPPTIDATSYLAHEILSINPGIGRENGTYDARAFTRFVHQTVDTVGMVIWAIRTLVARALQSDYPIRTILLERFYAKNAILHVTLSEPKYPITHTHVNPPWTSTSL